MAELATRFLNRYGWYTTFQDPATPIAERIIDVHNWVCFFLIIILVMVSWMLSRIWANFVKKYKQTWPYYRMNRRVSGEVDWKRWTMSYFKKHARVKFTHDAKIEIIWTLVPSFILVLIAIPSFGLLYAMDDVIDPEITIKTIGHQWYWSYEYNDYVNTLGKINFDSYMIPEAELVRGQLRLLEVDNSVVLPVGVYIRINVTSADVLHSWSVPSLGVKIDAVPHRINSGIIFLQRSGKFYGQCSEICGVNHGFMPIIVKSVSVRNYIEWLNSL